MVAAVNDFVSFESSSKGIFFSIVQVFAASLFLAFCSQICIPLVFSPVPVTGQTVGIMLVGAALGSRKGLLSVLAYLVEGSLGLPVFAGGSFGIMALFGHCGGYFLGFLLQVYIVGWVVERQTTFQVTKILPSLLLSCLLQMGLGVLWLSFFMSFQSALVVGFFPFLFGEIVKSILVTAYLKINCGYNLLKNSQ